jgi:hypothetical protein
MTAWMKSEGTEERQDGSIERHKHLEIPSVKQVGHSNRKKEDLDLIIVRKKSATSHEYYELIKSAGV